MNAYFHALATLIRRYRWEIAGFTLLVAATACVTISSPGTASGFTPLGILAFWWLTYRLILADSFHPSNGGWRTRPFPTDAVLLARISLLIGIGVLAALVRVLTLWHLFHPTVEQWWMHLQLANASTFLPWLALVASLIAVRFFRRVPLKGLARKAGTAVLAILAMAGVLWAVFSDSDRKKIGNAMDGPYPHLDEGIRLALPRAKGFAGSWSSTSGPPVTCVLRIPFHDPPQIPAPGLRLLELNHQTTDDECVVTLRMAAMNPEVVRELSKTKEVLGYADGSYGSRNNYDSGIPRFAPSSNDLPQLIQILRFARPTAGNPAPTEILFFEASPDRPEEEPAPSPAVAEAPVAVPSTELALIDALALAKNPTPALKARIAELPAEAIDEILAYHPWPDTAWDALIHPFLLKHATADHKPLLLARLASDPRLGSFFIEKGWSADALPVLRQRAVQRLPLDHASLMLLVEQHDASLAPHLAALAESAGDVGKLAPVLRASAGFDWPAFVAVGWKRYKYAGYKNQGWLFAAWAAELGDASALRRLAEEAAHGKKWEREQLAALVPGHDGDLLDWFRDHPEGPGYDAATRTWKTGGR